MFRVWRLRFRVEVLGDPGIYEERRGGKWGYRHVILRMKPLKPKPYSLCLELR